MKKMAVPSITYTIKIGKKLDPLLSTIRKPKER